jgi:hypothetical protein
MNIPISLESKIRLINKWGPEVILKCSCRQIPSHSMWGQYAIPSCPLCKQKCEVIQKDWGYIQDGS